MDKSLCTTVPSWMVSFFDWSPHKPGTNTLFQCPTISLGRVLFPSPVIFTSTHIVVTHCCVVMQLASQLKVNHLLPVSLGKHDAFQLIVRSYIIWLAA